MANNSFTVRSYGEQNGNQFSATPDYPNVQIATQDAVAAIFPYVNANLYITNGSRVVFKNASENFGLPTAILSNADVATLTALWNA